MSTQAVAEDRTRFIGGSDVAAILGQSPYKTRLQVYEEKIGEGEPFAGNFHTRRGNRQEAVAIEVFHERTGRKFHRVNQRMVHPVHPFLTAKLDGRIVGEQRVGEVKVPFYSNFLRLQREGLGPEWIAQMQHYIGLDAKWEGGEWVIFNPDADDLILLPMDRDQSLIDDMTARLVSFWNDYVMKRVPPPAELRDEERLEIARTEGAVQVFEVKEPEMIEAMRALAAAKALMRDAAKIEEDAKTRVTELTAETWGVYYAPGGLKLSLTQAKGRASFDHKTLAAAKPLDRTALALMLSQEEIIVADVREAFTKGTFDLDLTPFNKTGNPYPVMRLTAKGEK